MEKIKHSIPWILIISRLLSGCLFTYFSFFTPINPSIALIVGILFQIGFWGDILDGILARKWKVDSSFLRKSDSMADLFFWLGISIYLYKSYPIMTETMFFGFTTIGSIVLLEYIVCLVKFQKTPSAHAIIGKFWGILLFLFYTLVLFGLSPVIFGVIVFCIGIIARLDSLLIYLILKKWTHDIPSSYHAILINKNINFKRNSIFNSTEKVK